MRKIIFILIIGLFLANFNLFSQPVNLNSSDNIKIMAISTTLDLIIKGINILENIIKERKVDFQPFKDIYPENFKLNFAAI